MKRKNSFFINMNYSPNELRALQQIRKRIHINEQNRRRIQKKLQIQKMTHQRLLQQFELQKKKIKERENTNIQMNSPITEEEQRKLLNDPNYINSLPKPQEIPISTPITLQPNKPLLQLHNSIPKQVNVNIRRPTQIFGPFNCGTNLLAAFCKNMFRIDNKDSGFKKWKHTLEVKNFPGVFHICIIKNPFSWFQSLYKESYLVEWNRKKSLLHQQILMRGERRPTYFSSIMKLWLHYFKMYQVFAQKHPHNTCFITYDELLYDTDRVLHDLSIRLNTPLPESYLEIKQNTLKKPAKEHGKCSNVDRALKVNQLEYLFSKYDKKDVDKFFKDIPIHIIPPKYRELWKLQDWINHFNTPSEVSNAPSIQP